MLQTSRPIQQENEPGHGTLPDAVLNVHPVDYMSDSKSDAKTIAPWVVEEERTVYEHQPWLTVMQQTVRLPDGRLVTDYHKLITPDFVEIFAISNDGNVVVEKQYKHGIGDVSITLPAGNVEKGELPETAARRELLEETGYTATAFHTLGAFTIHGNYGCAIAHLFMATGISKIAEPGSDDLEEMSVFLMPSTELKRAVLNGEVKSISAATAIMIATDPTLVFTSTGAKFGNG